MSVVIDGTNGITTPAMGVGNQSPSNAGVTFPATAVASSDANTLDDYEEGTWTPTFNNFTVGNGSVFGRYTKIGNVVNLFVGFNMGSTSSIGGSIGSVSGLPFAIESVGSTSYFPAYGIALDAGVAYYSIFAGGNQTSTQLDSVKTTNNETAVNATNPFTWGTGDALNLQMTYRTS
jgi:hypothetical protein